MEGGNEELLKEGLLEGGAAGLMEGGAACFMEGVAVVGGCWFHGGRGC